MSTGDPDVVFVNMLIFTWTKWDVVGHLFIHVTAILLFMHMCCSVIKSNIAVLCTKSTYYFH